MFYEKELADFRNRLASCQSDPRLMTCKNKHAYEHIGVVQQFVSDRVQKDVEAERERHSRGYATFDMLWLLYKPGMDFYTDIDGVCEHEPWVLESLSCFIVNGTTHRYEASWWRLSGTPEWIGPTFHKTVMNRFAGEKEIVSLDSFPCEYLSYSSDIGVGDAEKIRQQFVDNGRKWFDILRSKKCYKYEGITMTWPRTSVSTYFSNK